VVDDHLNSTAAIPSRPPSRRPEEVRNAAVREAPATPSIIIRFIAASAHEIAAEHQQLPGSVHGGGSTRHRRSPAQSIPRRQQTPVSLTDGQVRRCHPDELAVAVAPLLARPRTLSPSAPTATLSNASLSVDKAPTLALPMRRHRVLGFIWVNLLPEGRRACCSTPLWAMTGPYGAAAALHGGQEVCQHQASRKGVYAALVAHTNITLVGAHLAMQSITEFPQLAPWIEYHRSIGVEHFSVTLPSETDEVAEWTLDKAILPLRVRKH
jgi:hypothetical protein